MANSHRKVFDCFLYAGEIDNLKIRLNELDPVVNIFVLIEGTRTFSGKPKELKYRQDWNQMRDFWPKLRIVVVDDWPETENAWDRERHQRNAILRGLKDAKDNDLILMSDVDEIPRADLVRRMCADMESTAFGLQLSFRYFALNYCNINGPESAITWTVACKYSHLRNVTPDQLRYDVRSGKQLATVLDNAGWHFSYLSDDTGIRNKIASFSHQELNTPNFLNSINRTEIIQKRSDFLNRPGFVWDVVPETDLPDYVKEHRHQFEHLLIDKNGRFGSRGFGKKIIHGINTLMTQSKLRKTESRHKKPIIVCPYVKDEDASRIKAAFNLEGKAGRELPFFLWKDAELIGPDSAYETCWDKFPGRDVIIIHSDMSPMPNDKDNSWYRKLCEYVIRLPDAGIVACDLLYPASILDGLWKVQCAGGGLEDSKFSYLTNTEYDDSYQKVREAAWVTFGGIYIRREVIDIVGGFDRRYKWGYVSDVDYSLEIRSRGYRLYQVPVTLQHEESRTTREFLTRPEFVEKVELNMAAFYEKWNGLLSSDHFGDLENKNGPKTEISLLDRFRDFTEGKIDKVALNLNSDVCSLVGEKQGGTIRSTGICGWLQYGPYITLSKGRYRVEWKGEILSEGLVEIGSVDVIYGGTEANTLARSNIIYKSPSLMPERILAALVFSVNEDTPTVEFRFFVNEKVVVHLSEVVITLIQ